MSICVDSVMTSITHFQSLTDRYCGQGIPTNLLKSLELLPSDSKPVLLIRHAQRPDIPKEGPDTALLKEEGKKAAQLLGNILNTMQPNVLFL